MPSRYCSETLRCGRCCQRRLSLLFNPAMPSGLTANPSLSGLAEERRCLLAPLRKRRRLVGRERACFVTFDKVLRIFFRCGHDVGFNLGTRCQLLLHFAGRCSVAAFPFHVVAGAQRFSHAFVSPPPPQRMQRRAPKGELAQPSRQESSRGGRSAALRTSSRRDCSRW